MTATRAAVLIGAIPIAVGLLYLVLQVVLGDPAEWLLAEGNFYDEALRVVAEVTGTIDPAGVILLVALGISMGFGFVVILRGARDL